MRYDRGYDRGRMGRTARHDQQVFRAGPPQGGSRGPVRPLERGYDAGMRGYDAGTMRGGTRGYDAVHGMRSRYDAELVHDLLPPWQTPPIRGGAGPRQMAAYDDGFRGPPRGYDRGMRGDAMRRGERFPFQEEGRPEDYHARFLPDSDEAGADVHRIARGRDLRYTSNWTRWF